MTDVPMNSQPALALWCSLNPDKAAGIIEQYRADSARDERELKRHAQSPLWQPIETVPFISAKRYLIVQSEVPFIGYRFYPDGPWYDEHGHTVKPIVWQEIPSYTLTSSNAPAAQCAPDGCTNPEHCKNEGRCSADSCQPAAQRVPDERRAFEKWVPDHLMPSEFSHGYLFKVDEDGDYVIDFVANFWDGWQARAALTSTDGGSK